MAYAGHGGGEERACREAAEDTEGEEDLVVFCMRLVKVIDLVQEVGLRTLTEAAADQCHNDPDRSWDNDILRSIGIE